MNGQTDNQQAKVSDAEYGWVAGFFDGEGSVLLMARQKAGKNLGPKIQPACKIQATDPESFAKLQDVLTRAGIAHHIQWTQLKGFVKDGSRRYKAAWTVNMVGLRRSLRFLGWITPALATKRERAELCLDYIQMRLEHSDPRTPINDAEIELVHRMRVLNASKKPVTVVLNRESPGTSRDQLAAIGQMGRETQRRIRILASTTAR